MSAVTDHGFPPEPREPHPIFNSSNVVTFIGALMTVLMGIIAWNASNVANDTRSALDTAGAAQTLALQNKENIKTLGETQAKLANIATDHETRISIVEYVTKTDRRRGRTVQTAP